MQSIRGAVYRNVVASSDRQRVNQPHTVFCIISNRRITGRAIGPAATAENGETGQVSVAPRNSRIQRGGKPNIISTTAGDAGYLKRSYDRIPIRESAGFNFRHVLGRRIGEAILAELPKEA